MQCEGAGRGTGDPQELTPQEADLLAKLRGFKEIVAAGISHVGWVGQVQGLGYPARWQIVDMPFVEILRATPGVFGRQARLGARWRRRWEVDPQRALAWFRVMAVIGLRTAAAGRLFLRSRGDDVIVDRRNTVALDGVDSTDLDTVLIWGPAHLRGLDAGLRQRGFSRVATDWYDVTRLPTITSAMWQAIRTKKRRIRREADTDSGLSPTAAGESTATPLQSTSNRPS